MTTKTKKDETMNATRHQDIKVSDLNNWDECYDAREAIESEPLNIKGEYRAWASGYTTELKAGAQRKVDAIQRKMDKLNPEEE